MKVSLIITTYNRPDALKKVFESIKTQTLLVDEVHIADDGSEPKASKTLSTTHSEIPFPLKHIWHEDQGFRAAHIRNKAIREATGDYIILLDGDCIVPRKFIEDHVRLAKKGFFYQGKRVVISESFSPYFTFKHANSPFKLIKLFFTRQISNTHHIIRLPWFPDISSTSLKGIKSCNMGFFREDIYAVNGFNEDFIGWGREDSELAVRFFKYGLKRKSHPFMAICFHLWHKENNRDCLQINDEILKGAATSNEYRCSNGLEKMARG